MERLFDLVVTSLWAPETYAKFLFLLLTAPFWWPLAKVMYAEILPALIATEDAEVRRRPPGEDPFLNIPLASHRARRAELRPARSASKTRRTRRS
jgi:hypothetical protein